MPENRPSPADLLAELSRSRNPRPLSEIPYVPASTEMQRMLAECWGEVLAINPVGIDDDLFFLGGDSLHMTQIAARIRERIGVEIAFEDFFSFPVLREMAKRIDAIVESHE